MTENMEEEPPTVMERRIAHANKVTTLHNGYITPTTIIFMGQKGETTASISQKHRALLGKILAIDPNASIRDDNEQAYDDETEMPQGAAYAEAFSIEENDYKNGNVYVKCEIKSKFSLYEMKNGKENIMQFLKENKIFLKFRKFQTSREATIGFLHSIHPSATLRSEIRDDIDYHLKTIPLKPEETEELLDKVDDTEVQ